MIISKQKLQQIIKEELNIILERVGTEKLFVDPRTAKTIIGLINTYRVSAKTLANKIKEAYYQLRRTRVGTEAIKNVSLDDSQIVSELLNVNNSDEFKSFGLKLKKIEKEDSSWVFFLVFNEESLEKIKSRSLESISLYTTVAFKQAFNTASEQDIKNDWAKILNKIIMYLSIEKSEYPFQFKYLKNTDKFSNDRDNLKFFLYIEKDTTISHNYANNYILEINKFLNESIYFKASSREGASIAREPSGISYGQKISAYLATELADSFFIPKDSPTKKIPTEQNIIDKSKDILGRIDPANLEFTDKYNLL